MNSSFIVFIAIGFFLFSIIYNFFLFRFSKDKTSKHTALIFFNYLIFFICSRYEFIQLFHNNLSHIICSILSYSAVFFIAKFYILYTKTYLTERGVIFDSVLLNFYLKKNLFLNLYFPSILICLTLYFVKIEMFDFCMFLFGVLANVFAVFSFFGIFFHSIKRNLHKNSKLRIFFWANIVIALGSLISFLFSYFISVSYSTIIADSDLYVSIIFSILLSISTSEKINFLTSEKERAQEKALIYLEEKVKERTLEISEQKNIIEEKQKEILDSITYAKRLQHAILPPLEFITKNVPNNFILYKPKDIVAGDFYWAEKIGEKFFIAAADSTGHGVPGAMVSVVCSNALNRTIKEFGLTDTGKILDKTRELVIETFEKSASEVKDGMDISLLCIDSKNKNIFWSGANNSLWYMQDDELKEIKADKQPIGKTDNPKPFTTHEMQYKENTTFYLFTDGLADQFGGPNGKKFKYKQFSDLLIKSNNLSQQQQAEIINKTFTDWKGELEQVDDICVIGIKI